MYKSLKANIFQLQLANILKTVLDAASLPEFLQGLGSLEEAECIFEHLIEEAKKFSSVELLLLYFISEEYLAKDDYLLNGAKSEWFLEFELLTLVSSQKSVLEHWSQNWGLHLADHDGQLLNEIYHISEMKTGVQISKESFPHLFDWYAKHVFSLPVHNTLAERQFNIADLYLDPNMSEETNQTPNCSYKTLFMKGWTRQTKAGPLLKLEVSTEVVWSVILTPSLQS